MCGRDSCEYVSLHRFFSALLGDIHTSTPSVVFEAGFVRLGSVMISSHSGRRNLAYSLVNKEIEE